MSVPMSLLAMLEEGPMYGLEMKHEFERRTGGVWPLNVGQVYTTLGRLERDGLVAFDGDRDGNKTYVITADGRASLEDWFGHPVQRESPSRDELVLKLLVASNAPGVDVSAVIRSERRASIEQLQQYTRLKTDSSTDADVEWMVLLDSLIFKTEAIVRRLDVSEARFASDPRHVSQPKGPMPAEPLLDQPSMPERGK